MITVIKVRPRSPAHLAGLRNGDSLLRINGKEPPDFLSYMASGGMPRRLEFKTQSGSLKRITDSGQRDFGIVLEGFRETRCRNRCVFCFVDQQPRKMRDSVYVKDDDYRLSFLHGNYVTLSGEPTDALRRIENLHLSPLYISVHSTDPHTRGRLLGVNRPAPILPVLSRLARRGIILHCQIVVCAGLNDGAVLEQTLDDLSALFPTIASVSITPVGLTRYREGLSLLAKPSRKEARRIVESALRRAQQYRKALGRSFIYPTDEMFIQAGRPVPEYAYYDEFCQIENGAGLLRLLEKDFRRFVSTFRPSGKGGIPMDQVWLTGRSAAGFLRKIAADFTALTGAGVQVRPVENRFWGRRITVSGLLSGEDLAGAVRKYEGVRIVLPPNCLNHDGLTLDGWSLPDLQKACGTDNIDIFGGFRSLVLAPKVTSHSKPWIPSYP